MCSTTPLRRRTEDSRRRPRPLPTSRSSSRQPRRRKIRRLSSRRRSRTHPTTPMTPPTQRTTRRRFRPRTPSKLARRDPALSLMSAMPARPTARPSRLMERQSPPRRLPSLQMTPTAIPPRKIPRRSPPPRLPQSRRPLLRTALMTLTLQMMSPRRRPQSRLLPPSRRLPQRSKNPPMKTATATPMFPSSRNPLPRLLPPRRLLRILTVMMTPARMRHPRRPQESNQTSQTERRLPRNKTLHMKTVMRTLKTKRRKKRSLLPRLLPLEMMTRRNSLLETFHSTLLRTPSPLLSESMELSLTSSFLLTPRVSSRASLSLSSRLMLRLRLLLMHSTVKTSTAEPSESTSQAVLPLEVQVALKEVDSSPEVHLAAEMALQPLSSLETLVSRPLKRALSTISQNADPLRPLESLWEMMEE